MNVTELKELLKDTAVFSILSDDELAQFAEHFEFIHYTIGQPVCRVGDQADALFIVYSGRARVVSENAQGEEVTIGTLTRGQSFGEQGLLTDSRRHYTVRAAGDLVLLRLGKADFEQLLGSYPYLQGYFEYCISETSLRNFLKLCTVFAPLSPQEIRDLLSCLEPREFAAGEAIIREGEPGDAFFIVRSGGLKVVKESEGGRVLGHLKPGDVFGELALLTAHPRAALALLSHLTRRVAWPA